MKIASLVLSCVALTACATQNVQIRSVPPETPAATNAADAEKIAALSEGAKAEAANPDQRSYLYTAPPLTPADAPSMTTYDPWERFNGFSYRFNARFDEALFLPVANTYRRLPAPLQKGVHNFFGNLSEVDSMINFGLQGRIGFGVKSLARFLINSSVGIGGLFDVAKKLDLPPAPTGFGTTLAKWGMHPGPYLVIPLLGPSTLRDGIGIAADFGTSYAVDMAGLYSSNKSWLLAGTNAIDQRANISFRYYSTGSAFEYETIRFLYVRKRLIEDAGLHADAPVPQDKGKPAGE